MMRRLMTMVAVVGLTLTACSGNSATVEPTFADSGEDGAEGVRTDLAGDEGEIRVEFDTETDRQVIRRASLQLQASDTRATFDEILAMVEAAGGFVADANVAPVSGDDAQPAIAMTLRVPAGELNATMAAIKDTADEVVSETQSAEDVTEQFIDLEARLTNLEALEIELRALLTEVRAREDADPDEILRVFNEVSAVRGDVEQLQGQINYLSDLTSLATLEVGLTQTPSTAPLVDEPWSPAEAARGALASLVQGLQGVADWAINFALYALPMLLIVAGPLVVIGAVVYRRFFRRPSQHPAPAGS
jgi:hypothetical protein